MRSYINFYWSIGETKFRECRGSLGGGGGGDAGVGGCGDDADAFRDGVGDFRLSEKRKGLDDLFMLLPLNP